MSIFKDKVLLITGGTGSFGNAVLRRFLDSDIKEIRIFSRDEKKQDDMRHRLQNPKVKFYIGNVRDKASVDVAMRGVDYVFAAAALKQVPSCEFFPMEATMTNVIGTNNVLLSAIEHGVKNVVVLSTDKAAYPINAMGISKALMEKVAIAKGRELGEDATTTICCTRYGNVMASRGSVIPLWVEQMVSGKPITITDPNMTRFMSLGWFSSGGPRVRFLTRYDGEVRELLVGHQGSRVSMRVARGSASLLPSHGRGIWPRDVLKKVSRGLSRVEAGNPGFPRLVQVTSGGFSWWL